MKKKTTKKVVKLSTETLFSLESTDALVAKGCTISIPSCCP